MQSNQCSLLADNGLGLLLSLFVFDLSRMAAARGFLNIVQPAQKSNRKFVEYYLLTFSRKYGIMIIEREGKTMIVLFLIVCVVGAIAIATM